MCVCVCVCVCYLAEFWQAYVHARPEAGAQVGGTCEDVAQTLVPHELPASLLDQVLHLVGKSRGQRRAQRTADVDKLKSSRENSIHPKVFDMFNIKRYYS